MTATVRKRLIGNRWYPRLTRLDCYVESLSREDHVVIHNGKRVCSYVSAAMARAALAERMRVEGQKMRLVRASRCA